MRVPKKAEICRRVTTYLYITVYNYNAVVVIYSIWCLFVTLYAPTSTYSVANMLRAEKQVRFHVWHSLLGAFAKLRKASIGFGMSVRPSVCLHGKTRSHRTNFHKILYLSIFRKTVQEIQVSLKPDKNNGHFI
jgi:hypothetical protein